MAKQRSKILVSISDVGADTYVLIANRINVGGPSFTAAEIDGSDMDSPAKEYFPDIPDGGEFSIAGNRNFGDAGQAALRSAIIASTQKDVRVEFLDPSDDSVEETQEFLGSILEFSTAGNSGSMVTYDARIRVSGAVTIT